MLLNAILVITSLHALHVSSSLMDDFKTLLDQENSVKFPVDEQWYEMPLSEIETPNSERCSLSYRSLPEHYPDLMCSGRTPFDAMFLNDRWISVPISSEDVKFKNMTKNLHCLLYTSPSPRDYAASRMPSSA